MMTQSMKIPDLYIGLLKDAARDGTRNTTLEAGRFMEKKGLVTISNIHKTPSYGCKTKRCDISLTDEGRRFLEERT